MSHIPKKTAPKTVPIKVKGDLLNDDDVENDDDLEKGLKEDTPLLIGNDTTQSSSSGFWSKIGNGALTVGTFILAVAASSTTAIQAFCGTKGNPENLGKKFWDDLDTQEQVLAVTRGASSLIINTTMGIIYLPLAAKKFLDGLLNFRKKPGAFIIANLGALSSGTAAFALAYKAFLSFAKYFNPTPIIAGAFNFLVTYVQRFVGILGITDRIKHAISDEGKIQSKAIDHIRRLKQEHLQALQALLDSINTSQENREEAFKQLVEKMDEIYQLDLSAFNEKDCCDYTKEYAGLVFDALFATAVGGAVFFSFAQKGIQALSILESLHGNSTYIESLPQYIKMLMSFPSGISSAIFYFYSAFEARSVLLELGSYLYNDPLKIIYAAPVGIVWGGLNYYASGSIYNLSMGVANIINNIFGIPSTHTVTGQVYAYSGQLSGFIVNGISTLKWVIAQLIAQKTNTVGELCDFYSKPGNVISTEAAKHLSALSLFSSDQQSLTINQVDNRGLDNLDLASSGYRWPGN